MRLAISNIAWDVAEDDAVVDLLKRYAIDAIDIAPGKYFPRPAEATVGQIEDVKRWWSSRGIEITGMQALLFGTSGLNVFGSPESRASLLHHLEGVCRIGGLLGATRIVFGSPKNRDRSHLDDAETGVAAREFFRQLGDLAFRHGVRICLEPNPRCYGANFMTSSSETASVVRMVNHPAIGMQFDTGALAINGEDPQTVLADCAPLIAHIHASEPNLVPLGDGTTVHAAMATAIRRYLPEHLVSIEMVATSGESHLTSIERSLKLATAYYRGGLEDSAA